MRPRAEYAIVGSEEGHTALVELTWDGKYDANGKRTAPVRIALPFQTVETVNESAQQRQRTLDFFSQGRDPEWRNRLIWGDKKYVLPSLLPEFAGKVDLIYIDPPFDTGADFSFTTQIPDSDASFTKEPSMIEQKAYRDTWGRGLDSYLQWFYETAVLLHELLSERGSIYVHLDWHVGHYAKAVLDEIFGSDLFINEIIWKRTGTHGATRAYGVLHDTILFYARSDSFYFLPPTKPLDEAYIGSHYTNIDHEGGGESLPASSCPWCGQGSCQKIRRKDPTCAGRPALGLFPRNDRPANGCREDCIYLQRYASHQAVRTRSSHACRLNLGRYLGDQFTGKRKGGLRYTEASSPP